MSEYERLSADWERLKAKEEAVIREAHVRAIRDLEAAIARLRPLTVRSATCCEACAPLDNSLREALAKVAALEARLAEVAPVAEAAVEWCEGGERGGEAELHTAVRAMLAARAKAPAEG